MYILHGHIFFDLTQTKTCNIDWKRNGYIFCGNLDAAITIVHMIEKCYELSNPIQLSTHWILFELGFILRRFSI